MRKLWFILVVLLVGCTQVTNIPAPTRFYIKDSAWDSIDLPKSARALGDDVAGIVAFVNEHNANNTDDQYFLLSEDVPIEQAPTCDAYITTQDRSAIIASYLDVPRSDVLERREVYRFEAYSKGGVLYVDNVPPYVEPLAPLPDYERYAMYLVGPSGVIYETHNENWAAEGFASIQASYDYYLPIWRTEAYARGAGYFVHAGSLYSPK